MSECSDRTPIKGAKGAYDIPTKYEYCTPLLGALVLDWITSTLEIGKHQNSFCKIQLAPIRATAALHYAKCSRPHSCAATSVAINISYTAPAT